MRTFALFIVTLIALPLTSSGKINVITSTSDLAYFAREIGGDLVNVSSIASPQADIHFVEVRPSYMARVARADVVFKVGLEMDMWMDRIIDGSRNSRVEIIDCSKYVEPLEIPTFKADARHGDLHPYGNPHYWLGPQNVEAIVRAVTEGLAATDPDNADQFKSNQDLYLVDFERALAVVRQQAMVLKGKEVVFYHNSWPYFNEFTGITAAGFIEPYPGVPPSPSHIKETIDLVSGRDIKVLAVEPYFDKRVPEKIASATGAVVVTLYPSLGGRNVNESYIEWLQGNIDGLVEVLK